MKVKSLQKMENLQHNNVDLTSENSHSVTIDDCLKLDKDGLNGFLKSVLGLRFDIVIPLLQRFGK